MNGAEKRRIQRVQLDCPITANLGGFHVTLIDLSADGAKLEVTHSVPTGRELTLELNYEGECIAAECVVVRCRLQRNASGEGVTYGAGVRFLKPRDPSISAVRKLIASYIARDLEARRQHAVSAGE